MASTRFAVLHTSPSKDELMPWDDDFAPVDEDARRRFEQDIRANEQLALSDYLPDDASDLYRGTLEELVVIELEHRWKSKETQAEERPRLETYLQEYPALKQNDVLERLVEEEFQIRLRSGDTPLLEEYEQRFPNLDLSDTFRQLAADTTPHASSEHTLAPDSRYGVIRKHAAGGMGVVYRATDDRIGREVALKHLRAGFAHEDEARTRFVNEAKLAGRLEHPGIVPVYDIGESADGSPYYAMKLVEGETFEDVIVGRRSTKHSNELRSLLSVLVSVSKTIAFAHDKGVLHRDLKPANIIVGNFGETVVLDWGLAKEMSVSEPQQATANESTDANTQLTRAGSVLGTPAYMPPEQATGNIDALDHRADVYALGAILFQILTGRPPVTTHDEFQQQLTSKTAPHARAFNANAPKPLDAIAAKAMATAVDNRYASASDFADEIERYLADEPVRAYADPVHVRVSRWARRNRTLVTTSAMALLLLSIASVAGGFAYQESQAERKRQIATQQTAIDSSQTTALEEIKAGRFDNGAFYLQKAIDLTTDDAAFADTRQTLSQQLEDADRLIDFLKLIDRAEILAWDEQDDDTILLGERALAKVHVFEHTDWWEHLTPFDLDAEVEEQLRQRVYRQLSMLVALRLKRGSLHIAGAAEFLVGGNQKSREDFEAARIPLEAAQRYRPAVGLTFAEALCKQQLAGAAAFMHIPKLVSVVRALTNHQSLLNPTDRYYVGLSMVYYADPLPDDPLVALTDGVLKLTKSSLSLENATDVALDQLGHASADQPTQFWTAITHAWAAEMFDDYATSIEIYNRCIALKPNAYLNYEFRARQYLEQGWKDADVKSAARFVRRGLVDLERAERLSPSEPQSRWYRSVALRSYPHADKHHAAGFSLAIEAAKLNAPRADMLHITHMLVNREDSLRNSLLNSEASRKANEHLPEPWLLWSLVHWRLGETKEAKKHLKRAMKVADTPTGFIIRGEMRLAEGKLKGAKEDFERALAMDETEYLARRGLAIVAEEQGPPSKALAAFRSLLKEAESDWQQYEALTGSCIAALQIGATDQAFADLEAILDLRPSTACESVVATAKEIGDEAVIGTIESRIAERSPTPTRPVGGDGDAAALINGGFELSLDQYWLTTPDKPTVWWVEGGCRSYAKATQRTKHSGEYSLRIQNLSAQMKGVRGTMRQEIPTQRGQAYRLTAWAKCRGVRENAVQLRIYTKAKGKPTDVISLPEGTSDWQRLTGTFTATSEQVTLEIISHDQGTAWLDDLRLETTASVPD